jgi:Oligoribonuclease (3''->5'' exoribonuclease)
MTGLDPKTHRIIEIATIVTDQQLNIIDTGPALAIRQSEKALLKMDDWCTKQHAATGLTERVRKSKITTAAAERLTLEFISQYVPAGCSPMCGNTIYQDRRFLNRYMPTLEQYFHYRNFDVSALKTIAKRWYPEVAKGFSKKSRHLALSDIHDSINELKYYFQHLLVPR